MKTFSELKTGDNVYFLIDTCGILNENGYSAGFANPNYGLVMAKRIIVSPYWEWHNPRTEKGLLFRLHVDKPILNHNGRCLFGPHINEFGNKSDTLIDVTKEMGRQSCIQQSFGDYFCSHTGYVFTTKEELETKIKSITDIVETNLKRIINDLKELL